ncbi:DUF2158 domain-containing protein [Rhodopseudomonas boonkerdii]|uniref:YodC family protein n=1 Tax=Rhodopseudomonas boonkerdii TaxID=475937 RepID=UPI001E287563|nr:DUF2158 domain-containing protein [Rhodopseudomonas boonkerdii]UGV28129.1 DUF2158 domain-containing protein [Rhodopseudomonas boonkerdii]
MELKAGDVVMLKSGGMPLTVADIDGDDIECVWLGEEGDLFRETLPRAVLEIALVIPNEHEDDEDEEEDEEEAHAKVA